MSTKPTSELDALDQIIKKLTECENLSRYLTNKASRGVGDAVGKAKDKAKDARGKVIKQSAMNG